ncbi:MAG: 3'-phosphoesterase [Nanoarchaeota archaeon]|nr:3'-phosphoesterase [Nanoarchaeota archaeon]
MRDYITIKIKMMQNRVYVIQFHRSKKAHYDLRLQFGNKLKSWAVPKKPSVKIGEKRLAVQVADHSLGYASFQGEIKEGYGKGTVKIWDKGTYILLEKTPKKILIEIKGNKLKGKYALIKFREKNWLFFKTKQ